MNTEDRLHPITADHGAQDVDSTTDRHQGGGGGDNQDVKVSRRPRATSEEEPAPYKCTTVPLISPASGGGGDGDPCAAAVKVKDPAQLSPPGGSTQYDSDSDGDDVEMTGGGCERCINIKSFAFFCCVFSVFSGALVSGYVSSVITTIEKRFEIGSSASGFIAASVEIGTLLAAIFISYFGSRSRIPAWIGYGACIQGIGACAFVLPHLLAETYSDSVAFTSQQMNVTERMCGAASLSSAAASAASSSRVAAASSPLQALSDAAMALATELRLPTPICNITGYAPHVFVLVLAQTLVGIGGSPLFTLGTTYIDDHVSRDTAPIYIACLYATAALGPVLGFGLGALMLQYYVDIFTFDNRILNLTPADPQWVGAWWGGFVIIGLLLLLISIPFFGFPKRLRKERRKLRRQNQLMKKQEKPSDPDFLATPEPTSKNYGSNIKDLPKSLWKLLRNPVYTVTSLGICCEVSIVSGFILFLPKYLETQFDLPKSTSNLLTGGIGIPGAVLGIMVGGYFLKRFNLKPIGVIKLTLILNFSASIGFGMLLFLGCDKVNLAGGTIPYNSLNTSLSHLPNLSSSCNSNCSCDNNEIDIVCGINGKSYFSPCHAGCSHILGHNKYSDCQCVIEDHPHSSLNSTVVQAIDGPCELHPCDTLTQFMIMLFVMTFLVASTQMPLLMTTLRCVSVEERALSLGLQFVMLRVFAYIPSPIAFGAMIDSTCILWEELCNGYGACLLYDIAHFRYKYIGYAACMKFVGALFFCLVGYLIKRDEYRAKVKTETQTAPEEAWQIEKVIESAI